MRSSAASPPNCQGRRHATPWLRGMKRQRHESPCQDVLLHLHNPQIPITAHILTCIKATKPWASKRHTRRRRMLGSILERHSLCVCQMWPFLHSPVAFCPFSFACLFSCKSLHKKAKSCNLHPGFFRLHRKLNSGAKGLNHSQPPLEF
jgi:hypothetical protein